MKRGFTIIELLVASALLGLLVTILTMIFNQSSIAWRVGVAGVAELGDVRNTIGSVREVADNAFVHNNRGHRLLGLWDDNGNLRNRACDAKANGGDSVPSTVQDTTDWFFNLNSSTPTSSLKPDQFKPKNVGTGSGGGSFDTYMVNVKSNGPDREPDTWDDIWSFPDDPTEW